MHPLNKEENSEKNSQNIQVQSSPLSTTTSTGDCKKPTQSNDRNVDELSAKQDQSHLLNEKKNLEKAEDNNLRNCMGKSQQRYESADVPKKIFIHEVRRKSEILVQSVIDEVLNDTIDVKDNKLNQLNQSNVNSCRVKAINRTPSSVVPVFDEHGNLMRENCTDLSFCEGAKLNFFNADYHILDESLNGSDNSMCKLIRNRPKERSSVKQKRDVSYNYFQLKLSVKYLINVFLLIDLASFFYTVLHKDRASKSRTKIKE